MTRAEIKSLAKTLAFDLHDEDTLDTFVDDVFKEVGLRVDAPFLKAKLKQLTSGIATYAFEPDMLNLIHAIMHDELLSPSSSRDLDAYDQNWPSASDTPVAFTQDQVDARNYTLYPNPDFDSDALIPIHGEPFGEDYPTNSLTLIYSDDRESSISDIFALPIAFNALSREFAYPSDHTDIEFSGLCSELSRILFALVGIS